MNLKECQQEEHDTPLLSNTKKVNPMLAGKQPAQTIRQSGRTGGREMRHAAAP